MMLVRRLYMTRPNHQRRPFYEETDPLIEAVGSEGKSVKDFWGDKQDEGGLCRFVHAGGRRVTWVFCPGSRRAFSGMS
jgi:hypothetical protein